MAESATPSPLLDNSEELGEKISVQESTDVGPLQGEVLAESRRLRLAIIKTFVGSAVLFLPSAFGHAGLIGAVVGLTAIAFLSIMCMVMLVECASNIESAIAPYGSLSKEVVGPAPVAKIGYGDVGSHAYGSLGRQFVDVSLVASQLGFCCVYLNYTAINLDSIIQVLTNCSVKVDMFLLILFQLPLCIAFALVRKLDFFLPTNAAANLFILAGLGYVMGFCFYRLVADGPAGAEEKDGPGPDDMAAGGIFLLKPSTLPLFLGSSIYTFEGIGLVLPLLGTTSLALRPHYSGVLVSTVSGLLLVYIFIGSVGYSAFGDNVEPAITSSLPQRDGFTIAVQLGYCLALLFTYPIMLFPVIGIAENILLGKPSELTAADSAEDGGSSAPRWKSNLIRAGIVLFTGAASIALEGALDNLVALVGALCSLPLAFIYPCLFHNRIIGTHITRNKIIIGLAVLTMIGSTTYAIVTWEIALQDKCEKQHRV